MKSYNNFIDGSKSLLVDSVNIVNKVGCEYAVIGGWCPFLRNDASYSKLKHPGTRDVDLLINGGDVEKNLKPLIKEFLKSGFKLSAKHDFQLFKEILIENNTGDKKTFVFHIDLLHPLETLEPKNLFVEHLDLGVPFDDDDVESKKVKSIALPSSKFIFEEQMYDNYCLEFDDKKITFPLIDFGGLIFSKAESVKSKKRYRDAFDIYLATVQKDSADISSRLKSLAGSHGKGLDKPLKVLSQFLNESPYRFNENVSIFVEEDNIDFAEEVLKFIE